jgi:hypothetical protein
MTNAFLLAGQRVEVEALIQDSTLSPGAFCWVVGDSETTNGMQVTRLEYDGADPVAFFQFDRYRQAHYAVYSWDGPEQRQEHITGAWPHQVLHVTRWLAHLADQLHRGGGRRSHPRWQWSKRPPRLTPPGSNAVR